MAGSGGAFATNLLPGHDSAGIAARDEIFPRVRRARDGAGRRNPGSAVMLISGHETRSMLERYNIVSLKNIHDAGAKLDAWQKKRKKAEASKAKRAKNVVSIRAKSNARSRWRKAS